MGLVVGVILMEKREIVQKGPEISARQSCGSPLRQPEFAAFQMTLGSSGVSSMNSESLK